MYSSCWFVNKEQIFDSHLLGEHRTKIDGPFYQKMVLLLHSTEVGLDTQLEEGKVTEGHNSEHHPKELVTQKVHEDVKESGSLKIHRFCACASSHMQRLQVELKTQLKAFKIVCNYEYVVHQIQCELIYNTMQATVNNVSIFHSDFLNPCKLL